MPRICQVLAFVGVVTHAPSRVSVPSVWDRILSASPWPGPLVITTSAPLRTWPANAPLAVSVLAVALSTAPPICPRTPCWIAVVCAFSGAMSCWARTYTVRGVFQLVGVKMISTADSQVTPSSDTWMLRSRSFS